MIHNVSVLKTEMSDHDIIHCSLLNPNLYPQKQSNSLPSFCPDVPLDDIDYFKADWDAVRKSLSISDWSKVCDESVNQDKAWSEFDEVILSALKNNAPSHTANINMVRSSNKNTSLIIPRSRLILLRKKGRLNNKINAIKTALSNQICEQGRHKLKKLNHKRAVIELQIKDDIKGHKLIEERKVLVGFENTPL